MRGGAIGAILLILLLALAQLPPTATGIPTESYTSSPDRLEQGLSDLTLRPWDQKLDPELARVVEGGTATPRILYRESSGRLHFGALVLGSGRLSLEELRRLADVRLFFSAGGVRFALLQVSDAASLRKVAALEGVAYVVGDWRAEQPVKMAWDMVGEELPGLTQIDVVRIMGAVGAWERGFDGRGVRIAVLDTGVDFGISDLKQARHEGVPLSIDTTGLELAFVGLAVRPEGLRLPLTGKTVVYFDGSEYRTYTFGYDLGIGEEQLRMSRSGVFKVGVYAFRDTPLGGPWFIPVVLVDSQRPGIYDTAFFDLSTFYALALEETVLKQNLPAPFPLDIQRLKDYSIADEAPHRWGDGSEAVARDINGDGWPDISLGSLAWVDDSLRPGGLGKIPGLGAIDEATPRRLGRDEVWHLVGLQGNRFSDHGTLVATAASGSGTTPYFFTTLPGNRTVVPGVARGATVMALATRLFTSEIIRGWLWAAGLEPRADGSGFEYHPWRRADVISNSWGFVSYAVYGLFPPGLGPFSVLANLLSIPGYLHPQYPGIVIVVSAGNSGYGYGTVSEPSAGLLTISVGASTSYRWIHYVSNGSQGAYQGYDDLAGFSSRGPTTWGYVKPDVLAVGSAAIGLRGINWGGLWGYRLHGYYIATVWAGTSLSAPLVSGAVAIIIQAMKALGMAYDPQLVKDIIMASARDLGYDPYTQGAGRVDVLGALQLVQSLAGQGPTTSVLARSTATYESVRELQDLQHRRAASLRLFFGGPLPPQPLEMASLYLGIVKPGSTRGFQVSVHHGPGAAVEARAIRMVKVGEQRFDLKLDRDPYFVDLVQLWGSRGMSREQLLSADLLRIYVLTDQEGHLRGDRAPYAYLVDWLDENGNGRYDLETEQHRYSFDSRDAVVLMLSVARPRDRFLGTPGIVIRNPDENFAIRGAKDLAIVVQQFKRVEWPEVRLLGASPTPTGSLLSFQLQAPARPGFSDGYVEVLVARGGGGARTLMPLSFAVPLELGAEGPASLGGEPEAQPYDDYSLLGGEDWRGRANTADHRFYPILLSPRAESKLLVSVAWKSRLAQLNIYLVGGDQTILHTSPIRFEGAGRYSYSTTTGEARQVLATTLGGGRLLTLVVQQVISTGFRMFPEAAEARLLQTDVELVTISYSATSQAALPGPSILVAGNFTAQVRVNPAVSTFIQSRRVALHAGGLLNIEGRIQPTDPRWTSTFLTGYPDAPTHFHDVALGEGQTVYAKLDWAGDADLDLVVLWPTGEPAASWSASATLRKPERFTFTVPRAGTYRFAVVSFASAPTDYTLRILIQDGRALSRSAGPQLSVLDTSSLPDGEPITLLPVVVLNAALNPPLQDGITPITIVADNTPPRLAIKGPEPGSFIHGDLELDVQVEDPHFSRLVVEVDGRASEHRPGRIVLSLPDGDHTITLRAWDLVGNQATRSLLVRVDRTEPWVRVEGLGEGQYLKGSVQFEVKARPLYLTRLTMALDGGAEQVVEGSITLDTTRLPDGPHTITLRAYYESGKTAAATIPVHIDNTPPSLRVLVVAEGAHVRGLLPISVSAEDLYLEGVAVEFGGRTLQLPGSGQISLDTSAVPDGAHRLVVRAWDRAGHTSSLQYTLVVDNTPPKLAITAPGNNTIVIFTTRIALHIEEPHLKGARLYIGGRVLPLDGLRALDWNTLELPDGWYVVRLEAEDMAGNTASVSIRVWVANTMVVGLTLAAAGAIATALLLRRRSRARLSQ